MKKLILVPLLAFAFIWYHYEISKEDLLAANIAAMAGVPAGFPEGVCLGTGPHFTNVSCPGGEVICCWAHTDVFGKGND